MPDIVPGIELCAGNKAVNKLLKNPQRADRGCLSLSNVCGMLLILTIVFVFKWTLENPKAR